MREAVRRRLASDNPARHAVAMRLRDALEAMDARSFERLCRRRGVSLDERKRISEAEQAARQLVDWALKAPIEALPKPAQDIARHLTTHREGDDRRALGGGVLPLMELDVVFAAPGAPERVAMPSEIRVQLAPHPGEDRSSARALLAMTPEAAQVQLGTQLLGRRPVGPAPMWLGRVLERLEDPTALEALLDELSPKQRRLLEAIEARGGQLETEELLDLERSPVRVQLAGGAALPTRSASHQLFVRGLLLPRARGLWAVPTEVAKKVGASRRSVERARRRELLAKVAEDEDLSPPRARLADDPTPAAVALVAALDATGALPAGPRAVRRSALEATARQVGVDPGAAELLVVVARAAGSRLGTAALHDVGALLFRTWRDADAWDEARRDADAHRAPDAVARTPTPTRGLRDALLELLEAMPSDRFAPIDEVTHAAARDLRNAGAARLLERADARHRGAFETDPAAITRRIATGSLVSLGAVDRGVVDGRDVVRLSARARRWLSGARQGSAAAARWEGGRLRAGGETRVDHVVEAAVGAHPLVAEGGLSLRVDADSVGRALDRSLEPEALRERFERLARPLDDAVERALASAAHRRPKLRRVPASAFVPIDDPELRARVADDPELREIVLARVLDEGVLVREGVSIARLSSALARLGIDLESG